MFTRIVEHLLKAGGERAGHKYIRRVRTVGRGGKSGWRYIYQEGSAGKRVKKTDPITDSKFFEPGGKLGALEAEIKDTPKGAENTFKVPVRSADGSIQYAHFSYDKTVEVLEGGARMDQFLLNHLLSEYIPDFKDDFEPDDIAESITNPSVDHQRTLNDIADVDVGPTDVVPVEGDADTTTLIDGLKDVVEPETQKPESQEPESQEPESQEPETQESKPQDPDVADAIRALAEALTNIAPSDGKGIRFPTRGAGRTVALLLVASAIEVYKTATVDTQGAVSLDGLENMATKELRKIPKAERDVGKRKLMEALNKDRRDSRSRMTPEELIEALKQRQNKSP